MLKDQAAYQKKIADLEDKIETQQINHLTTISDCQIAHLSKATAEEKARQDAENVLLSEQKATEIQYQAAYQKKIADLKDKIETQQTDHLTMIAHLSKETEEEKARQDTRHYILEGPRGKPHRDMLRA